jgi:hypothetical protein
VLVFNPPKARVSEPEDAHRVSKVLMFDMLAARLP